MTRCRLKPAFIDSPGGRIFVLLRAPEQSRGCVLFVPGFAEEMNKCRRQITETAIMLAKSGYASILVDLSGTGDSAGDFRSATWGIWKANVSSALSWAAKQGFVVRSLVGTRLGCALAAESVRECGHSLERTVFWQPVESGRRFMTQFLRLRLAASMMLAGDEKETVESLRERLNANDELEVAGYMLRPRLVAAIDAVDLASGLDSCLGSLLVLEVGRTADSELSATGRRLLSVAEESGLPAAGRRIAGDPFWNSTEIVVNRELGKATARFLSNEAR